MNNKIKHEMLLRKENHEIINNVLMPNIKEIIVDNSTQLNSIKISNNISKIDKLQEDNQEIKKKINKVQKHTDKLTEENAKLDKFIEEIEGKL